MCPRDSATTSPSWRLSFSPGASSAGAIGRNQLAMHCLASLLGLDGLISGILANHLAYLITDLLPVANEIACTFHAHHLRALVFENQNYRFRIGAFLVTLSISDRSE